MEFRASDSREIRRADWTWPSAVFVVVLVVQLVLVAGAGTDIPFQDQWDVEGRRIYPAWREGRLVAGDFFQAHNEHRIAWTHALNLALLAANGQWDPLVQMVAMALLRAVCAAGLAYALARGASAKARPGWAAGVMVAFLPHLAWHNVLWGFQSQVYFSLLFSLAALALLGEPNPSVRRQIAGLATGGAGLLAMGAGALVPVALLGLITVRAIEQRRVDATRWREAWPAFFLLAAALALRVDVPAHAALHAESAGQFCETFLRVLAWPHAWQPAAAFVLNVPLASIVVARLARKRRAATGEDFVLLLGGWALATAGAMAWSRGASGEFYGAVPSRYVDFVVLLPLANVWCLIVLVREAMEQRRRLVSVVAAAWSVFLLAGWLGLSTQMMRRIILPRMRDREAPVRLAVAFQRSGDATVFAGQPTLLVPHPNPESVRTVLNDPKMRGVLPPSLQPGQPMGPLSRVVRVILRHD